MASAVLTGRNESSSSFMGKTPFSNTRLIPKSNSLSSRRQTEATFSQIDSDELPSVSQSLPDDASSFNRKPYISSASASKSNLFNQGDYLSFDIASYQRKELIKLKKRWIAELERIRSLANRIESGEFLLKSPTSPQRPTTNRKEDKKRALPLNPGRDSKRLASSENIVQLMKMCGQVLTKLMKHKRGYIFNSPVDVVTLGLHDYNHIVKQPMDLGTVKSKLGKNLYDTPLDFASDVRLTFKNAMLYNPRGHEVHELADQLLFRFNDLFRPVYQKCLAEQQEQPPPPQPAQRPQPRRDVSEDLQGSSWNRNPEQEKKVKKAKLTEIANKSETVHVPATSQNLAASKMSQSPEATPSPRGASLAKPFIRTKQPKPKAKDPNKREMTLEEKHKLGAGLQSLPDEKMTQVVHIIKKRNEHLTEDCDEIELDIEAVDRETLWELDRFVTNWKKMVSKISRQALMGSSAATSEGGMVAVRTESDVGIAPVKKVKKVGGEEDVDIGDDMPVSSFPPVEIEKDDGRAHANSSSSSSSGSSSDNSSSSGEFPLSLVANKFKVDSSIICCDGDPNQRNVGHCLSFEFLADSGSGSCSGSDSDADNPQSRDFSRM